MYIYQLVLIFHKVITHLIGKDQIEFAGINIDSVDSIRLIFKSVLS